MSMSGYMKRRISGRVHCEREEKQVGAVKGRIWRRRKQEVVAGGMPLKHWEDA